MPTDTTEAPTRVVRRRRKPKVYAPDWLIDYARKAGLSTEPDKLIDAFVHAIEQSTSNAEAYRLLDISKSTFQRSLRKWKVTIER